MLRSYLTVALRFFSTQKLYTGINVLGLAIGLAACLMISVYVRHELSYDAQFPNAERIYRISRDYYAIANTPARSPASNNAPVAPALLKEFSEIEQTARVLSGRMLLSRDNMAFYENRFRWADPSFLEIFRFEWLAGDAETALDRPASVVLTASVAKKYFGTDDPIGQTITLEGSTPMSVTGVIADLPNNTHLSLDAIGSMSTLVGIMGPEMLEQWNSSTDYHTYFLLRQGADVKDVVERIPDFMDRRIAADASERSGMTIMNIRDIHVRSQRDEEWKPSGNLSTIYGFVAIALLILLIACINFMNLSTARAAQRAKEVGVRKTVGATRAQLVAQLVGESVLTVALAMLIAAALVELLSPAFGTFVGTELSLQYFGPNGMFFYLLGLALLVGLIAGSYPAFYLSAFEAAKVLKGDLTRGTKGALFRNGLVTAQFAIAIALVIATAVVFQQTSFARNLDLGFNKDNIVLLQGSARGGLGTQWQAFKEELLSHPGVLKVTASHYAPFAFDDNRIRVRPQGGLTVSRIQYMAVDYGFFETYEIDVLAGRTFSPEFGEDTVVLPSAESRRTTAGFIINQSAARLLGWSTAQDALNEPIENGLDDAFSVRVQGPVVGIVRDTYFESVQRPLRPMIYVVYPELRNGPINIDVASIRIASGDEAGVLAHITQTWRRFQPDQPPTLRFLQEDFDAMYQNENRQAQMFGVFSMLAIIIACLGLLGLTSFSTERRTKEIGVRKVMGGTVTDIMRLFTGEFSKLVLMASVVAWPVAYYFMRGWLNNFAYRVDLSPLVFLGSAALTLVIAALTVAVVSARAAATNPAYSLRYE